MTLENIFLQFGAAGSVPGSGQLELARACRWMLFPMGRGFLAPLSSFFSNALIFYYFFLNLPAKFSPH